MLNPRQRAVLAALVRGPVDPAALGDRLELPVSAVVAHVEALREHGFAVARGPDGFALEDVPAYGYGVQAGLAAPFVVDYAPTVASTNDRARELAARGAADVAVLADEQTGGRGRLARGWTSPPGGIYCSLLLRPSLAPERLGLLALAAAVAARDAVASVGVETGLKWPNDVQGPDGRKLAGILAESATADGAVEWAVVGLGLNANAEPTSLPRGATSLRELTGGPVDRRAVVQRYLESFHDRRRDLAGVLDAWRARTTTLGRRVRIKTADGEVVGEAVDVDAAGALLVETADGIERVAAGDCEHLRPAGG